MAFVGIPTTLLPYPTMDLQVKMENCDNESTFHLIFIFFSLFKAQAAIKWLSGDTKLPSKKEMMQDLHVNTQAHYAKTGYSKWKTHYLIALEKEYLKSLEILCDIKSLPDVMHNIARDSFEWFRNRPTEFRKFKYTVIDGSNFTRIKVD